MKKKKWEDLTDKEKKANKERFLELAEKEPSPAMEKIAERKANRKPFKKDEEYERFINQLKALNQNKEDVTILPGTITTFEETMEAIKSENAADEDNE